LTSWRWKGASRICLRRRQWRDKRRRAKESSRPLTHPRDEVFLRNKKDIENSAGMLSQKALLLN